MKLCKLIGVSLLVSLNVYAVEVEEKREIPIKFVESFYDYCVEIVTDDEPDIELFLFNCVNEHLNDAAFKTFDSYQDLINFLDNEGDDGNRN
jgi:DUF971 family protein